MKVGAGKVGIESMNQFRVWKVSPRVNPLVLECGFFFVWEKGKQPHTWYGISKTNRNPIGRGASASDLEGKLVSQVMYEWARVCERDCTGVVTCSKPCQWLLAKRMGVSQRQIVEI